jgi:hypothetical protein
MLNGPGDVNAEVQEEFETVSAEAPPRTYAGPGKVAFAWAEG